MTDIKDLGTRAVLDRINELLREAASGYIGRGWCQRTWGGATPRSP